MIERIPDIILVGIGGVIGAMARYWISGLVRNYKFIPIGTLMVNVLGSFLLMFLITLNQFRLINSTWIIFLGIGIMGSFTTMSTFVVETIKLGDNSMRYAGYNVLLTLFLVFIGGFVGQSTAMLYINGRSRLWN